MIKYILWWTFIEVPCVRLINLNDNIIWSWLIYWSITIFQTKSQIIVTHLSHIGTVFIFTAQEGQIVYLMYSLSPPSQGLTCTQLSNKNPSSLSFLRPELEVTWRTAAIIIWVLLLSPYLRICGVSLSSIHGWKTRVGNYQKLKTDLAVTIQSLTLCWVEAESFYRSVLRVSRCNTGSWMRASSSLQK
jgi:hypothetical protein